MQMMVLKRGVFGGTQYVAGVAGSRPTCIKLHSCSDFRPAFPRASAIDCYARAQKTDTTVRRYMTGTGELGLSTD